MDENARNVILKLSSEKIPPLDLAFTKSNPEKSRRYSNNRELELHLEKMTKQYKKLNKYVAGIKNLDVESIETITNLLYEIREYLLSSDDNDGNDMRTELKTLKNNLDSFVGEVKYSPRLLSRADAAVSNARLLINKFDTFSNEIQIDLDKHNSECTIHFNKIYNELQMLVEKTDREFINNKSCNLNEKLNDTSNDRVLKQLALIDVKLDEISGKIDKIDQRLLTFDCRLSTIDSQLSIIEHQINRK